MCYNMGRDKGPAEAHTVTEAGHGPGAGGGGPVLTHRPRLSGAPRDSTERAVGTRVWMASASSMLHQPAIRLTAASPEMGGSGNGGPWSAR